MDSARGELALGTLDFLEAAYAWHRADEAWLNGVLDAMPRIWGSMQWIYGTFYDASDVSRFRLLFLRTRDVPAQFEAAIKPLTEGFSPEIVARVFRGQRFGFLRPLGMMSSEVTGVLHDVGTAEIFGLNAIDPEGLGCNICIGTERTRLEAPESALFERLTAHLVSAYRCRRRLRAGAQTPLEDAEMILDPEGRVLDASGLGRSAAAREAVALAARDIKATRQGTAPGDPSAQWRPRVQARWTLLDIAGSQGEEYVVARVNQTTTVALDALTDREKQIVASAAYGRSNKEIAYDLGISHSTARVLLARACARLGVRSREELLALPAVRAIRGEGSSAS